MGNHFAISTTVEGKVSGSVHKKVLMNILSEGRSINSLSAIVKYPQQANKHCR